MAEPRLDLGSITLTAREQPLRNPGLLSAIFGAIGLGLAAFLVGGALLLVGVTLSDARVEHAVPPAARIHQLEEMVDDLERRIENQTPGVVDTPPMPRAQIPMPVSALVVAGGATFGGLALLLLGGSLGVFGLRRQLRFCPDGLYLDSRRIRPGQITRLDLTDGDLHLALSDGRCFDVESVEPALLPHLRSAAREPLEQPVGTEPEAMSTLRRAVRT